MHHAIESLPAAGRPEQLMLLLHGDGGCGLQMAALAEAFRAGFPQAAIVAPDAPQPLHGGAGGAGRAWFAVDGVTDDDRGACVDAVLPALAQWVQATQRRLGVGPQATALVGFSQGAILALELAQRHDGLVGRVLGFGGRYARLPEAAPCATTLHLFHGGADAVIGAHHARAALQHLAVLHGDATLDIAEGVGHELHPALIDCALHRLTHHIPHRTWRAALGVLPVQVRTGTDED